jgi:hypothetical protein
MKKFKYTQFHFVSVRTFVISFYNGSGSSKVRELIAVPVPPLQRHIMRR